MYVRMCFFVFFFFNDTATTEIYTLSLHDALPIWPFPVFVNHSAPSGPDVMPTGTRSEEHTSELQSRGHLVCRLLLEKKKLKITGAVPIEMTSDDKAVEGTAISI